ncbi:MAG: PhzF family phenazine biosynthesis isomerase [Armatimonadota bacterium]
MKQIPFFIVDSFTDTPFQGNPAGVFFDREGVLSDDEMRHLAGEVHLESAFVLPAHREDSSRADFRLRYFTGVCEVPLCGHATIAALTVLHEKGNLQPGQPQQAATLAGVLAVGITPEGEATLRQRMPDFGKPLSTAEGQEVTDALGLDRGSAGHPNLPIQAVSTGTPWLLVPVRSRAHVDQSPTDFGAINRLSDKHGTFGFYVFVLDASPPAQSEDNNISVWSRCYAPKAGLNEDPVTGSASGALGGYLAHHGVLPLAPGTETGFTIRQGFGGGRGGQVAVRVGRGDDGQITPVTIQGRAVILSEGLFTLP